MDLERRLRQRGGIVETPNARHLKAALELDRGRTDVERVEGTASGLPSD
jgi:hypothetical protein